MTLPRLHPRLLRALQIAVAAGLLLWLWHVADGAAAVERLASANPFWLLAAGALLTLQTVLSALRWRLTASQLGIVLDRWTALREYYLSQIVNQALPGGVLGDAGRAVRARGQAGLLASGQAVVFERLAGQIAMYLMFLAAFIATLLVPGGFDWPRWLLIPVLTFFLCGLALPVLFWFVTRIASFRALSRLATAFAHAVIAPPVRWRQLVLSLGTALCNIAAFASCAYAIGVEISATALVALIPLILFTMVIPITMSGWGLREGAAAVLFPVAGASASDGLATSIAFGMVILASALPGVVFVGVTAPPNPVKS